MALPDVLVVEDDADLNELIGAYVCMAGLSCRSALTGSDAIREIETKVPAAVVLDLMLPDMSGFDICRRIKGTPACSTTRVIILTAMDSEASRQHGREVGADEYLTKPFDPDHLMQTVARHACRV
ncbi:MAG TPA: response regulator [Tepidisphaeraceae bacterium]|jgi:DNA-binding response OmpR family regulator|nr:response regulator [Tepidisphaeraceae bacterium]